MRLPRPFRRPGTLLMLVGSLLMASALALLVQTAWEDHRARADAQGLVLQLTAAVAERTDPVPAPDADPAGDASDLPADTADPAPLPDYLLYPEKEMPLLRLEGYDCVGLLELPTLERTLPVLAECTDSGLKHAPCRYSGSAYTGDLVIAGHNYTSHFARLGTLLPGDPVLFTDGDGNCFRYQVSDLETLTPTAVEDMTTGDWALTLFTCTYGNRSRLAVRCILSEPS